MPKKCHELTIRKQGHELTFQPVSGIDQLKELKLLGVTLQSDCRFISHVSGKLKEANKCLYILRSLRRDGLSQAGVDNLFKSIVLPKITYGLSVYGASQPELSTVQRFLHRCFKRRYISYKIDIYELLELTDSRIFNKMAHNVNHPLKSIAPVKKDTCYLLRKPTSTKPKVRTERFKNSFINRLHFKYGFAF